MRARGSTGAGGGGVTARRGRPSLIYYIPEQHNYKNCTSLSRLSSFQYLYRMMFASRAPALGLELFYIKIFRLFVNLIPCYCQKLKYSVFTGFIKTEIRDTYHILGRKRDKFLVIMKFADCKTESYT